MLAELRVATVPASVNLSLFADFQNVTGFAPGPHQTATLDQVLDQVVAWSRTLAPLRLEAAS